MGLLPEQLARIKIDAQLTEAGWNIVSRDEYVPHLAQAVKEALMSGSTESDYLLFVDNKAIAVVEAKREENDLGDEVASQAEDYALNPRGMYGLWSPEEKMIPLVYLANGNKILFKLGIANCIRFMSEGNLNRGIGCMNELFCTKDTDWAYQDEWRLIGNAEAHCTKLKVKAVYIGFKATDNNILKIKRIAKKKGFKVFLMNAPKGKKKIKYFELV